MPDACGLPYMREVGFAVTQKMGKSVGQLFILLMPFG